MRLKANLSRMRYRLRRSHKHGKTAAKGTWKCRQSQEAACPGLFQRSRATRLSSWTMKRASWKSWKMGCRRAALRSPAFRKPRSAGAPGRESLRSGSLRFQYARMTLGCWNILRLRAAIIVVIDDILFRVPRDGLGHGDLLWRETSVARETTANTVGNATPGL